MLMDENRDGSLTIACISIAGGPALLNCIRSVLRSGLGCIVVADKSAIIDEVNDLVSEYHLELICTKDCSVPRKRAKAVYRAETDWIALIEDTCAINNTWRQGYEEMITCKSTDGGSGPVNLGQSLDARSRALYCTDYGKYFPVLLKHAGDGNTSRMLQSETLPGVNLLYRRAIVMQYINDEGLIESEVNRRMNEEGHELHLHEDLAVTLEYPDVNGATLRSRFSHGHLYGGLQSRNMTSSQRILRAIACGILPFVLSYRSLRALAHDRRKILATAMFIVAFETAWSCGECTGYLLGCGKSLDHWK